jgi:hypothetical protein
MARSASNARSRKARLLHRYGRHATTTRTAAASSVERKNSTCQPHIKFKPCAKFNTRSGRNVSIQYPLPSRKCRTASMSPAATIESTTALKYMLPRRSTPCNPIIVSITRAGRVQSHGARLQSDTSGKARRHPEDAGCPITSAATFREASKSNPLRSGFATILGQLAITRRRSQS